MSLLFPVVKQLEREHAATGVLFRLARQDFSGSDGAHAMHSSTRRLADYFKTREPLEDIVYGTQPMKPVPIDDNLIEVEETEPLSSASVLKRDVDDEDVETLKASSDDSKSKGSKKHKEISSKLTAKQPIFVNPKQYHRILRRREIRAQQKARMIKEKRTIKLYHDGDSDRTFRYESRHLLAKRRKRGRDGKFLSKS